jgi:hypothetical protein
MLEGPTVRLMRKEERNGAIFMESLLNNAQGDRCATPANATTLKVANSAEAPEVDKVNWKERSSAFVRTPRTPCCIGIDTNAATR